jgi:ankyrin repeat protein
MFSLLFNGTVSLHGLQRTGCVLFQNGESALHAAALFGHISIVKQLISAGADPRLRNQEGATPLQLAQEAKQIAVVEYLRDRN